ncbi:MAG TPA: hypothetical protein VJG32_17935 [Anaerolineae bacterium]|nr:hypothetical protein [Anaerolineae bacterium]
MSAIMPVANHPHTASETILITDLPTWKRELLDQIDLLFEGRSRCTIVIEKDGPAVLVLPAKPVWRVTMVNSRSPT